MCPVQCVTYVSVRSFSLPVVNRECPTANGDWRSIGFSYLGVYCVLEPIGPRQSLRQSSCRRIGGLQFIGNKLLSPHGLAGELPYGVDTEQDRGN